MNVINIINLEKDENYILEADRLRIYYNINEIEDITFRLYVLKLSDGFLYKHDSNIAISYGLKPLPYTLDILAKYVLQHPAVRTHLALLTPDLRDGWNKKSFFSFKEISMIN